MSRTPGTTSEEVIHGAVARLERAAAEMDKAEAALLPCPFCGPIPHNRPFFDYLKTSCVVKCDNCGCHGPKCDDAKSAALNWNTRP